MEIKLKSECRWDLISLGEVLLRFDSGDERIHTAQNFRVFDGGGEYNVARNLAKTFRQRTAIITALADNALGRLAENLICQGGVDSSEILWRGADGKGENTRNGIYFIERGFGLRSPSSCFDRSHTAISQLKKGDINWQNIFGQNNATRWFHTGGVFVGLSATSPNVAAEAMQLAKESGSIVSFDLNYRDSLWRERGGLRAANKINRELLQYADVAFGTFEFDSQLSSYNEISFRDAATRILDDFPNLKIIVSTLRQVHSASLHDLSAVCLSQNQVFKTFNYFNANVFDRVGSGDAFAAGFIYGFLSQREIQYSLDCGTAMAVLTMTTPGDNSSATLSEVEKLILGDNPQVIR